jgi:hypothetical protein
MERRNGLGRISAGVVSAAIAVVIVLVTATAGYAADPQGFSFGASPVQGSSGNDSGYFKFNADSGSSVSQVLHVSNRTSKARTIRVAAVDGAAAVYGGVSYSDSDKLPSQVGNWITLSKTSVDLAPGASVDLPFIVKVPADASTGNHYGGIAVWEPASETSSKSGGSGTNGASMNVTMITRMVIPVAVTTPGLAEPNLVVTGVKAAARSDGMYLLVNIKNDGTALTSGKGALELPDQNFQHDIKLGDMIPASGTDYPVKWSRGPEEGTYSARVQISYADGAKTATWSGTFKVASAETKDLGTKLVQGESQEATGGGTPWLMYGLVAGLVVIVAIMAVALLRRRRPSSKA